MSSGPGATTAAFWKDVDDDVALRRYQTLTEMIDDGIYQLDSDGRFVAVNDAVVELTGYSRDDLVGEHISLVLAGNDAERVDREITNGMQSNEGIATLELAVRTADGETVRCELRATLLVEGGNFQGIVGVLRNRSGTRPQPETSPQELDDSIIPILDEANIGVFVLDDEFDVVWADESIGQYFGIERDDLIGRDKRQVVNEMIRDRIEESDKFADRVLSTYDDNTYIEEFVCHVTAGGDREERWLEHRSQPIETGEYAGGRIEFYYEITNRMQSAETLQETEAEFHSLVDAVEEYAIFRLDPDGHVISWNEGAKEIKGYESEEILGEHFSTFYTDEDQKAGVPERNLKKATEMGTVKDEGWRVRKNGSTFWGNVTITSIRDEDGTHQGFLKITRDMTDRHSEQEIQSELQRIFDRISDAFFAVDEDFRFTHANERAEQLIQHSEEELRGETLWDVIPSASEIEEVRKAFKTASNSQEAVSIEFYHDGLDMWIEGNLYPSETGISVYFRDVTERREYEQKLEESNERLEQFAYAASHDLQEPLRMVSSYLQLIEGRYGDGLDEDGREFLEFAVDGADRMRDMIDGLLEYSRVESQGEAFEPVELDDVLGDVRESLRMKVDENDAEISAGDLPRVEGDHGQLRQLFQNLLDNAIEYSGDEPPRIHVSAERAADRWIVSVRDEGVGIDPSDTDRIFNVFQSLHTPDQQGGTGIGLALCQRIVERHGGDIWVDSEPGEGSTFSFTLPAVGDDDE
ncbi:hypothetical protein BRC65_05485 [Halobacteriales archaeon QH_2_65_14]|nr:MAG: hypothetical protein BRC65_05485 [Halobacteriales archaeon QH_2_65_14]